MRDWKDRLGIFASAACAVHCAATPFLVAALPTLKLTEWMADPRFHQFVAVICCCLVAIAILPTALRLRDLRLLSLASTGLGCILVAAFLVPDDCCSIEDPSVNSGHSVHDHSGHEHSGHEHLNHDHHDLNAETPTLLTAGMSFAHPWLTPVGGLLLIVAHAVNMRRRRKIACTRLGCCADVEALEILKVPEHPIDSTLARAS